MRRLHLRDGRQDDPQNARPLQRGAEGPDRRPWRPPKCQRVCRAGIVPPCGMEPRPCSTMRSHCSIVGGRGQGETTKCICQVFEEQVPLHGRIVAMGVEAAGDRKCRDRRRHLCVEGDLLASRLQPMTSSLGEAGFRIRTSAPRRRHDRRPTSRVIRDSIVARELYTVTSRTHASASRPAGGAHRSDGPFSYAPLLCRCGRCGGGH